MSGTGKPEDGAGGTMRMRAAREPLLAAAVRAACALRRRALVCVAQRWTGRAAPPRGAGWRPLSLRWARRTALPVPGTPRAPVAPAASTFHWHLHLATRPGIGPGARPAPATGARVAAQLHTAQAARAPVALRRAAAAGGSRLRPAASAPASAGSQPAAAGSARADRAPVLATRPATVAPRPIAQVSSPRANGRLARPASLAPAQTFPDAAAAPGTRTAHAAVAGRPVLAPAAALSAKEAPMRRAAGSVLRHRQAPAIYSPAWPRRPAATARAAASAPPAPGPRTWRTGERAARAASPAPAGTPARGLPAMVARRPADLAWPAVPAAAATAGPVSAGVGSLAERALPATPRPAGKDGMEGALRATALDPALARSLADEVIRRIEHRARIERERRGL